MSFDLEKARDLAKNPIHCFETDEIFADAITEIERLRAEMDNYADDFVCQMKSKDARIKELEDALAEGKIGPDTSKPRSWQITDERKAAVQHCKRMLTFLKEDDAPCYDVEKITKDESVLVAMLKDAEQE